MKKERRNEMNQSRKNLVELVLCVVLAAVKADAVGARLLQLARARTAALRRQVLVDDDRQISLKKIKKRRKEEIEKEKKKETKIVS